MVLFIYSAPDWYHKMPISSSNPSFRKFHDFPTIIKVTFLWLFLVTSYLSRKYIDLPPRVFGPSHAGERFVRGLCVWLLLMIGSSLCVAVVGKKYGKKICDLWVVSCFFNVLIRVYGVLVIPKWLIIDS